MSVIPVRRAPTLGIPTTPSDSGPVEASTAVTGALRTILSHRNQSRRRYSHEQEAIAHR